MIAIVIAIPGWKLLRSLGGVGLVLLGIVDSSVIPTFGSLDLLTAILAVKNRDLWPYYAAASTAGSLLGAYITYRMSARAGEAWLEKRIGKETLSTDSRPAKTLGLRCGVRLVYRPAAVSHIAVLRGSGSASLSAGEIRVSCTHWPGPPVCGDWVSGRKVQPCNITVPATSAWL